jgi:hypothetical protein
MRISEWACRGLVVASMCASGPGCSTVRQVAQAAGDACGPATIVVNTVEEGTDENHVCARGGPCTVRAAIFTATFCNSPKTIQLQAKSAYRLTAEDRPGPRRSGEDDRVGLVGLPRITADITIDGNGSTIERASKDRYFRIFHVQARGRLTLRNLTLRGGAAQDRYPARFTAPDRGGAIYNEGTLTLERCRLEGNQAQDKGGAIENLGTLTVSDTTFSRNTATQGGAISNEERGNGMVTTSQVSGNEGGMGAGIAVNGGTLRLVDSTVSANTASNHGGGAAVLAGTLEIERSTFAGNGGPTAGNGGGLLMSGAEARATVRSSTFSGNDAETGGGVMISSGTLEIADSTFSANRARFKAGGGGLNVGGIGRVSIRNSIVAGNPGGDCGIGASWKPADVNFSPDRACGFSRREDPMLQSLTGNGGPTQTHALAASSPAIDAGGSRCLDRDQRGERRPARKACDVGAYEVQ